MNMIMISVGFVALGLILVVLTLLLKKLNTEAVEEKKLPFKLKNNFFTRSEWEFFRILEEKIDHTRFSVFPKVRLGDFVEVDAPKGEKMQHWNRIKSKHVDFLVYDTQKSSIAFAIELDGYSHSSQRMQKSDDFKNKLYQSVGLELVRVKVGTDFISEINNILSKV